MTGLTVRPSRQTEVHGTQRPIQSGVATVAGMSQVSYEQRDRVAYIQFSDPDRGNPINQSFVDELGIAIRQARTDDVHVVVLSSAGRAFSFGGDIQAFAATDDVDHMIDDLAESLHRQVSELHRINAIVVSVVSGTAAGAGVALAASADIVLAAESAKFTLAYTKIGLSPDGGSSLLISSIGLHRALRLALLNPVLSAKDAQAAGFVSEVHPDDELGTAVEKVVRTLRSGSRSAQVAAKRLFRETATPSEETALRRETLSIRACASGPDGVEGVAAFLAKRAPEYPSSR